MKNNALVRFTGAIYCLAFVLIALFSCHRYYMPVGKQISSVSEADSLITFGPTDRYLILHADGHYYHMRRPVVDQTNQMVKFYPETLEEGRSIYISDVKKKYRYKGWQSAVLQETHIYVTRNTPWTRGDSLNLASLPLSGIEKVEFIEKNSNKTAMSYVLGGLAIAGAAIVTFGVILILSSCPYVSVKNGNEYVPQGELFGGALYPALERKDYLPLQMQAEAGRFEVKIHNELQEVQNINYAHLRVIEHAAGKKALASPDGQIYLVGNTEAPSSASLNGSIDQTVSVSALDKVYSSFSDTNRTDGINELQLRFRKPANAKQAKLVLSLRHSLWFEYLYGDFTSAFGSSYNSWVKNQQSTPASTTIAWVESQHMPIRVKMKDATGKQAPVLIQSIGPVMSREIVIPLELGDASGDFVEVSLSTGFMFWDIDYAGISFEEDNGFSETVLKPSSAIDEQGVNRISEVSAMDSLYVTQHEQGNALFLEFAWDKTLAEGRAVSVILEGSGHYRPIREYKGMAKIGWLSEFKKPGHFSSFSRSRYIEILKQQSGIARLN